MLNPHLIHVKDHSKGVAADKDDNNEHEDHGDALVALLTTGGPAHSYVGSKIENCRFLNMGEGYSF